MFRPTVPLYNQLLRLTLLTPDPLTLTSQPRDPYGSLCMTFQLNERATKQHALCVCRKHKIFVQQRACPMKYSSAWMYSTVHMCALLYCIILFSETAQALWKTEGEYFQATEREDISLLYSESFVPWQPSSAFILLYIISTSKQHHHSNYFHVYCTALITKLKSEHLNCCLP